MRLTKEQTNCINQVYKSLYITLTLGAAVATAVGAFIGIHDTLEKDTDIFEGQRIAAAVSVAGISFLTVTGVSACLFKKCTKPTEESSNENKPFIKKEKVEAREEERPSNMI